MKRFSPKSRWVPGVVVAGLAMAAPAWADRADALYAVLVLRTGGCGGTLPAAPALRYNAVLDSAAERWATGSSLSLAAERSGYGAKSTAGVHITGSGSSTVQQLRRSSCRILVDPNLKEIGVYHRGWDTWIVLASARSTESGTHTAPAMKVAQTLPFVRGQLPTARPPTATTLSPTTPDLAARAVKLVNDVRARGTLCGHRSFGPAPPVTLSSTLDGVAFGHARDMADHGYFEHQDLTGRTPADRVRAVGYRENLVGENIAYGPISVEEVVRGWLDSPGHCENIMDPRFAEMGIALAPGNASKRGPYWVQLLAAPRA